MSKPRNTSFTQLRAYMLITLMLASVSAMSARIVSGRDSVSTYFRLDKSQLALGYQQNETRLDSFMKAINANSFLSVNGMKVTGAASPEGNPLHNLKLSADRAASLIEYISKTSLLPDSIISMSAIGGDFAGLREMINDDMDVPGRKEALAVLDDTVDYNTMVRLRNIDGGRTYQYMKQNIFPELRKATLIVDYSLPSISVVEPEITLLPTGMTNATEMSLIPVVTTSKWHAPRYMALKTNMLYDLAAVPNISFEYYIGRNWSLSAQWMGAWWSRNSRHRYWRVYGGMIEARRWFGKAAAAKPLTGHHMGLYAGAVTFDFEWNDDGYMGGLPHGTIFDRCMLVGGVEYGYSLPVAKRLNIDFSIGIGYFGGKYIKYSPMYGHYYKDSEMKLNYFGPTKAEISLVWLIGHGNCNR